MRNGFPNAAPPPVPISQEEFHIKCWAHISIFNLAVHCKSTQYNTNEFRDLPADAAPQGILENGDTYYIAYKLLTPSDTALIESITGNKAVEGDPLAGAIGTDRAHEAIGWPGGLTGDVTVSYLQSIDTALENAHSDGTYEGFQITSKELNDAIGYLTANDENPGSTSNVSISA